MESHASPLAALRRSQLLYVVMSLAPLGVMTYLAVAYIFPTLQEKGQDVIIYSILATLVLTATLSLLGYLVSKNDTMTRIEQVERSRRVLSDMFEASQAVGSLEHKDDIARAVAEHTARAVGARAALVWLDDERGLRLVAAEGGRNQVGAQHLEYGKGMAGKALKSGNPLLNAPLTREDRAIDESVGIHTLHGMAVPVGSEIGSRGVISVHDRLDGAAFVQSDLALVRTLAQQCAWAVHSAVVQEQQRNYFAHVTRILSAFVERSMLWSGHIYNVDRYSSLVARALELDEELRRHLHFAATLHDIGLAHSLHHPNGRSFEALEEHPIRGHDLVSPILIWRECAPMIRTHHEHMDGTGYPGQLQGDEIPIGGRILAIAEWWDEKTNPASPFQEYAPQTALDALSNDGGRRFDPAVAKCFCEVVLEHG